MKRSEKGIQLGFTAESFPDMNHICLIYDNEEQRQKILSEYLAAGIKEGEFVRFFSATLPPEKIFSWLSEMDLELPDPENRDFFDVIPAEKAYCPDGHFEPHASIDRAVNRYDIVKKAGFCGSRVCGEMSWVLKGIPGSERFLEYEAMLNMIDHPFRRIGMCQYDARLFDGATLLNVLKVHPYIIAQGQIVSNPFYIRPEEFLKSLNLTKKNQQ
jgi:hypothetical protein